MSLIKKQFDILVSSNPVLGANNVRNNGGTFTVNFEDNGLDIPKNAENMCRSRSSTVSCGTTNPM